MTVGELEVKLAEIENKSLEVAIMENHKGHGGDWPILRSPDVRVFPQETWSPEIDGKRRLLEKKVMVYL